MKKVLKVSAIIAAIAAGVGIAAKVITDHKGSVGKKDCGSDGDYPSSRQPF